MSDTPRTDRALSRAQQGDTEYQLHRLIGHARKLERELRSAQEEIGRLAEYLECEPWSDTPRTDAVIKECAEEHHWGIVSPLISLCEQLEREITARRMERDELNGELMGARTEIERLREQLRLANNQTTTDAESKARWAPDSYVQKHCK